MKIRIQDNSIRLRLTRVEVDQVQRSGRVDATINFPGGVRLDYSLESLAASQSVEARFADNGIVVSVPEPRVRQWASTDEVSIAAKQLLDQNNALAILVEKDFACLAPRAGEDDSDMFPHPLQGQESC